METKDTKARSADFVAQHLAVETDAYIQSLSDEESDALGKAWIEEKFRGEDPLTLFVEACAATVASSADVKENAAAWTACGYLSKRLIYSEAFLRGLGSILSGDISGVTGAMFRLFLAGVVAGRGEHKTYVPEVAASISGVNDEETTNNFLFQANTVLVYGQRVIEQKIAAAQASRDVEADRRSDAEKKIILH